MASKKRVYWYRIRMEPIVGASWGLFQVGAYYVAEWATNPQDLWFPYDDGVRLSHYDAWLVLRTEEDEEALEARFIGTYAKCNDGYYRECKPPGF